MLESDDDVVGIAHNDHVARGFAPSPALGPQIEDVVQVDIGKQRRDRRSLSGPPVAVRHDPVFEDARLEPLLNQADDARVADPMLDEANQPLSADFIEERADVGVKDEVHFLTGDPDRERVERVVRSPSGSESVREPEEVLLCPAACRMRVSACDTLSRSCARRVLCWPAFPSAPVLGSAGSDPDRSASFVGLLATMTGSDFSCPFIAGCGSSPSRRDPATLARPGWARDLPVPAQGASAHARVSDHAGLAERLHWRARSCCLPLWVQRRRPGLFSFRGAMAGLRPPLPTLRRRPRGRRRTARGRCGSPLLHRIGLSPTTPCQSPGAHPVKYPDSGK